MKTLGLVTALGITFAGFAGAASADPWKDESGNGNWRGHGRGYYALREPGYRYYRKHREYKEEYRRGRCEIERKWDDDEYKEEIKCKRGRRPSVYYDLY
jgi:hypothetical protein